jgi:hypothetical protein
MHRFAFLPLLTTAAGLAGALIRRYELQHAFESDTGLALSGYPASVVLLLLSAAVILFVLFLSGGRSAIGALSYRDAFRTTEAGSFAAIVLSSLFLFGSAASGAMLYLSGTETRVSRLLLFAFTAISGACILVTGLRTYRDKNTEQSGILLLVPAFFACLWLVLVYQTNAADPVLLHYIYELLAVVFAVLGLYSIAGFGFGRGRVKRTAFYCLLGEYFSLVTLADGHSLPFYLLYAFSALYLVLSAALLLKNSAQAQAA